MTHKKGKALAWIAFIFFLFKAPLTLAPYHFEELVMLDAATRAFSGEVVYLDFYYIYGPLPPYFYAIFFSILPKTLLTIRLVTLLTGCGVALLISLVFEKKSLGKRIIITLLATLPVAIYPAYAHNHTLSLLGLVGSITFLSRFIFNRKFNDLIYSYGFLILILLSRPAIAGFGATLGWLLVVLTLGELAPKERLKITAGGITGLVILFGGLYAIFGDPFLWALTPRFDTLDVWKPNSLVSLISALYENFELKNGLWNFRQQVMVRGAFLCFVLAPGMVFYFYRKNRKVNPECANFVMISCLIVYGGHFVDTFSMGAGPLFIRGQYFWTPLIAATLVIIDDAFTASRRNYSLLVPSVIVLGMVSALYSSYFVLNVERILRNERYTSSVLKGTVKLKGHDGFLKATEFINSRCRPGEKVLVGAYHPGAQLFLKCENVVQKDCCFTHRNPNYVPRQRETPYSPNGRISYREIAYEMARKEKPKFRLVSLAQHPYSKTYAPLCEGSHGHQDFPWEFGELRVCWD